MKRTVIPIAALLCAMPASGEQSQLPQAVVHALTPIDSLPSIEALNSVLTAPVEELRAIALDPTVDLGVQLRAIRALASYCPPAPAVCGVGTPAHDALVTLIGSYQSLQGTPQSVPQLLRLRAAVEALGAARSGSSEDVDQLLPFLESTSRDLRVTVVRALRGICNMQAIAPLSMYLRAERSAPVRSVMSEVLRDLHQCR